MAEEKQKKYVTEKDIINDAFAHACINVSEGKKILFAHAFVERLQAALLGDQAIRFNGFGTFTKRVASAIERPGIHLKTHERITVKIPEHIVVRFKASPTAKKLLNA